MGILQNIDSTPPAADSWRDFKSLIKDFKKQLALYDSALSGAQNAGVVVNMCAALASFRSRITPYSAVLGITAVAQNDLSNGTVDVASYIASLQSGIDAALAAVNAEVPANAQGYSPIITINADGTNAWRQFNATRMAVLRAPVAALLSAI